MSVGVLVLTKLNVITMGGGVGLPDANVLSTLIVGLPVAKKVLTGFVASKVGVSEGPGVTEGVC